MKHDTTPATKADLSELEARLQQKLDAQLAETLRRIAFDKEEIMRHFDVVAENLFHDLAGASHDEIEVLKDRKDDHERRILHLEQTIGIVSA